MEELKEWAKKELTVTKEVNESLQKTPKRIKETLITILRTI